MIAGAGEAGMAIMGIGQAYAMGQFAAFTRVQESTADQIAAKLLLATHQSPMGMYHTFQRFANEEAMSAYKVDKFAVDHPTGQDRVFDLKDMVEASPYREVQDSPESLHTFQMVQAKLAGYVLPVKEALTRYPESDTIASRRAMPAPWSICASPICQGAGHDQQPDRGRAQQSLFLRSARPDLYEHGQARAGHSRLSEVGRPAPARAAAAAGAGHRPARHRE